MTRGEAVRYRVACVVLRRDCVGSDPKAAVAAWLSMTIWAAIQDALGSIPSVRPL